MLSKDLHSQISSGKEFHDHAVERISADAKKERQDSERQQSELQNKVRELENQVARSRVEPINHQHMKESIANQVRASLNAKAK